MSSVASIVSGTPAGVTANTALYALTAGSAAGVLNSVSSVNIEQTSVAALTGINIICDGPQGIDIHQSSTAVGSGFQIVAQGDNGVIIHSNTTIMDLQSAGDMTITSTSANVDITSQNADVNITSTTADIDLAAAGTVRMTGNETSINTGNIGFFTAIPAPQQTQAIGPAPAADAGAGAAVLDDTTFGNGANKYSLPQVIAALQLYGILA